MIADLAPGGRGYIGNLRLSPDDPIIPRIRRTWRAVRRFQVSQPEEKLNAECRRLFNSGGPTVDRGPQPDPISFEVPNNIDSASRSILGFLLKTWNQDDNEPSYPSGSFTCPP